MFRSFGIFWSVKTDTKYERKSSGGLVSLSLRNELNSVKDGQAIAPKVCSAKEDERWGRPVPPRRRRWPAAPSKFFMLSLLSCVTNQAKQETQIARPHVNK